MVPSVRSRLVGGLALQLLLACAALVGAPQATGLDVDPVPAADETVPVLHSGDAADDPAIWVHPTDRSRSLVLGNDKGPGPTGGALESYDLEGNLVQRISAPDGFWGNVDVRQGVGIASAPPDVVAVVTSSLRLYTVDPATRQLRAITDGTIAVGGEGLCLHDTPTALYAFVITRAGLVRQVALTDGDGDGLISGQVVRSFEVGSEAEGCVADDETGALYVSEEEVALWRYGAAPDSGSTRTEVDSVTGRGGRLTLDIEGLTLVHQGPGQGYLIASAQNASALSASSFAVYDRAGTNAFVKSFRVTDGAVADDCDGTDGIAAYAGDLGPLFPNGLFVCQDNNNAPPGTSGNQNFKYVDLAAIVAPPPDRPPTAAFTTSCVQLTCDFDASGSSDPEGELASWTWTFGDGTTGDGASPTHDYLSPGTYPVRLTVTDGTGATATVEHPVTVSDGTAPSLSFVAANSTNANRVTHTVGLPAGVAAGDRMLLFLTANSTSGTLTPPPGWTQLFALDQGGVRARVWTRAATATDAGSPVVVRTSAYAKSDLTVVAYRSASGTPAVTASAQTFLSAPGSAMTSPTVTAGPGSWLVTYWGAKSGSGAWTPPSTQLLRAQSHGTGGGPIHGLLTDSGGTVPSGTTGGVTASLASAPGRAVIHSLVLSGG